jgi:O-antigen/teichoic acid export membrane protein
MLGALGGDAALGLYSVAYSLVERATTVLCLAITSATFPMAVKALEHDGLEAGRRQAGRNGVLLISVATPACVGLALIATPLAAVVVGPEFRDGVAHLIPIVAVTALVRSISTHFVDHAFMLSKRSDLNFTVYVPPALASILLSAFAIPRWGATGAALTGLVCQIGQLILGTVVGRRIFPLWLPGRDLAKMFVATAAMCVCLTLPKYPTDALGLLLMIIAGAASYGLVAVAIDLMGSRHWALRAISR